MDRTGIMVLDVIAAHFAADIFHGGAPDPANILDRLYVSVNSSKIYDDPSFEKYFTTVVKMPAD